MNLRCLSFIVVLALAAFNANALVANDVATQNAILAALPEGVSPENATADEIAQAATNLAFGKKEGKLEDNLAQVMVSLG